MPGNLSSLGFGSAIPTKQIVNQFSSGGVSVASINSGGNFARTLNSGALTAGTLSTLVTVTGSGMLPYLVAYTNNATARTIRVVLIIDGVTVFDATSDSISATGRGMAVVGCNTATGFTADGEPARFNSSCVIRVASSLTETDNIGIAYKVV